MRIKLGSYTSLDLAVQILKFIASTPGNGGSACFGIEPCPISGATTVFFDSAIFSMLQTTRAWKAYNKAHPAPVYTSSYDVDFQAFYVQPAPDTAMMVGAARAYGRLLRAAARRTRYNDGT